MTKKYLREALTALDREMGKDPWLIAFAPIRLVSTGGFPAVSYYKNRESTEDVDYIIQPDLAGDKERLDAFKQAILSVADEDIFTEIREEVEEKDGG